MAASGAREGKVFTCMVHSNVKIIVVVHSRAHRCPLPDGMKSRLGLGIPTCLPGIRFEAVHFTCYISPGFRSTLYSTAGFDFRQCRENVFIEVEGYRKDISLSKEFLSFNFSLDQR